MLFFLESSICNFPLIFYYLLCFLPKLMPKRALSPDQCGSVGWASSLKVKGHKFDSCSGHMPRLWVWSLVGAHMRGN